jgi:hypothetical protein
VIHRFNEIGPRAPRHRVGGVTSRVRLPATYKCTHGNFHGCYSLGDDQL